jgi:hypothetical protein
MPLALGTRLSDRYRLDADAGQGASAKVFRATDERTGKTVAIKVFSAGRSADEARWLARELKALSVLDHPNVVRMLDASLPDAEQPWICTEWLDGSDLQTLVEELGALSEAAVVGIGLGALAGLEAAHALTIVHRDLKPANIFVCKNGRVVLLDFGVARAESDVAGQTLAGSANTTIVGTPAYLSPEQLGGQPATMASDVYSLGVALRFLLAGAQPFAATQMLELIKQIMSGQLSPLAAATSKPLRAILDGMVATDPQQRIASAQKARRSLVAFSQSLPSFAHDFERFCARADETTAIRMERDTDPMGNFVASGEGTQVTTISVRADEGTQVATITVKVGSEAGTSTQVSTMRAGVATEHRLPIIAAAVVTLAVMIAAGFLLLRPRSTPKTARPAAPTEIAAAPAPPVTPSALPPPVAIDATPAPKEIEAPRPAPEPPRTGTLQVTLKQWANVKIDGKDFGRRQLSARFELPSGKHHIVLQNPAYGERTFDPVLRPGQTQAIEVDFK